VTSAQVVETSVTNNSSFQNYPHTDGHTKRTTDTRGLKLFTTTSFNLAYIAQEPEVRIPITQGIVGHVATTGKKVTASLM